MFDLTLFIDALVRSIRFVSVGAGVGVALVLGLAIFVAVRALKRRRAPADAGAERARIEAFLACKRIALVGASTDAAHFSRLVMHALKEHGIDVIPIHPHARTIEGLQAYPRVADVAEFVSGALIMTPAATSAQIVEECGRAGITRVWLHRGAGVGAVSEQAIHAANRHGLQLVSGRCPLMFLGARPVGVHRMHAAWLRLVGRYPLPAPSAKRGAARGRGTSVPTGGRAV